MTCASCNLEPAAPGSDRCQFCTQAPLIMLLSLRARAALFAIQARHPGLSMIEAVNCALIMHDRAERGEVGLPG